MLVFKIYDCKLRKNKYKWRFNQNTTEIYWNKYQRPSTIDEAIIIANNINKYFPHIKMQKNTRIEFYYS